MKINTESIQGYADMTAEEKIAALEAYEMEFDTTGFIDKKHFDKTASEAAEYKRKYRATLSEKEQLEIDEAEKRKAAETELAQLKREMALNKYKTEYIKLGYSDKDADSVAVALLEGDMEKVFSAQQKFLKDREAAVRADMLKDTPKPPGTNPEKKLTKAEFSKMSLIEKQQLAVSDPDTYRDLFTQK